MTNELESALARLLKDVVQEAAADLVDKLKASISHQEQQATLTGHRFLLTPRETAKGLSISERHLFQLTRTGRLPCVRIGKSVRYSTETIQKWIREMESAEPPPRTERDDFGQLLLKPAMSPSPRRKTKLPTEQKQGNPVRKTLPVLQSRSPKLQKRISNQSPPEVQSEERVSPFSVLLSEHGIERSRLGLITNGELMRIAEVDIATMHGWLYLNRPLPADAINRLTDHFRRMVTKCQQRKYGAEPRCVVSAK